MSARWRQFADLVGIEYPIMQDGMGPSPTTYLAAAVSAAGGLGTVSCPSITNTSEEFLRQGFRSAIEHIAGHIERIRVERDGDIAHRRTAITGVNEFPNLAEAPLAQGEPSGVHRYAAAFEALRDRSDAYLRRTGSRPKVLLLPLGPLAENNIRATFATASGSASTPTGSWSTGARGS